MMSAMETARTIDVVCPHCAARWMLPADRVGAGGARVHCAKCERAFEWRRARRPSDGAVPRQERPRAEAGVAIVHEDDRSRESFAASAVATAPLAGSAVDELDAADATPTLVARLLVEELIGGVDELLDAYDRGALFERCGPALIDAWSRYRARLGPAADPAVFRAALVARLGIDLPGWEDRG